MVIFNSYVKLPEGNLHVAENPSNQSKIRRLSVHWCALHHCIQGRKVQISSDIHVRGNPWKHWKSASTPRSAVEKDRQIDGLAVAQPALSCFPLQDVYGSRMVHHANTIWWFVVSTHPDPSRIFMIILSAYGVWFLLIMFVPAFQREFHGSKE